MKKFNTRNLVLGALFCALIAVGAQITIPLPYGAFTLQLFFVLLASFILPPVQSLAALAAYLLLGFAGAPVFAAFSGGLSSVLSPTFGFITGMVLSAPLTSLLFRRLKARLRAFPAALLSGLACIAVTYLCGAIHGYLIMRLVLTKEVSLSFIVWNWCLVYLPFDAAKLLIASAVAPSILRRLPAAR
jgi:biotin transport system substrate-specific component